MRHALVLLAVLSVSACQAPASSPMGSVAYVGTFTQCQSKSTATEKTHCFNEKQRPMFTGRAELFQQLANARLEIARQIDLGVVDRESGNDQFEALELAADRQMNAEVQDYNIRQQNIANAINQSNANMQRSLQHQQMMNAINRPTNCNSYVSGRNISTNCF